MFLGFQCDFYEEKSAFYQRFPMRIVEIWTKVYFKSTFLNREKSMIFNETSLRLSGSCHVYEGGKVLIETLSSLAIFWSLIFQAKNIRENP